MASLFGGAVEFVPEFFEDPAALLRQQFPLPDGLGDPLFAGFEIGQFGCEPTEVRRARPLGGAALGLPEGQTPNQ